MGRADCLIVVACALLFLVLNVNAAPNVTLSVLNYNLHVDTKARTALSEITCASSTSQTCVCNLVVPTTPANAPFDVWKLAGDANYKVYFIGTQSGSTHLSTDATPYVLGVKCSDGNGTTVSSDSLEVDILPNAQPIITGYPAVTTSSIDAKATGSGTVIYTLTVTDPENDALTYSMTQRPDSGYFTIGATDGIITTAVDMKTVPVDSVVCTVSVSDGTNTVTPFTVTVKLSNLNSRPTISNLPATINVTEDTASGFTLLTLSFSDVDTFQTLVPECSVDPSDESYKFVYETNTRRLKLNSVATGQTLLDYETTNKYTITCSVSDGYLSSVGDVLTVYVTNINEPPVFNSKTYYCTLPESAAGMSICTLPLTVTDPELNTITSVALQSGGNNDLFRYTHTTTSLTFKVDYDVDNSKNPTSATLTLVAVDALGASSSATIQVVVQDVNDQTCVFSGGYVAQFNLNQGSSLQTLGNFAATDADLTSPNNLVSFEVASALPTSSYNYLTVFGNGEIRYIGLIPESEHGKSFSLVVRCKDGGTPSLSASATVLISYLTTTSSTTTTSTTTTTTTTASTTTTKATSTSLWSDPGFLAMFGVLMALLCIGLIVGLWYLCTRAGLNFSDICGPRKEKHPRIQPVREYGDRVGSRENMIVRQKEPRLSPNYRDQSWRTGDHFEDGIGYDGRPVSNGDIFFTGYSGRRALPAPKGGI